MLRRKAFWSLFSQMPSGAMLDRSRFSWSMRRGKVNCAHVTTSQSKANGHSCGVGSRYALSVCALGLAVGCALPEMEMAKRESSAAGAGGAKSNIAGGSGRLQTGGGSTSLNVTAGAWGIINGGNSNVTVGTSGGGRNGVGGGAPGIGGMVANGSSTGVSSGTVSNIGGETSIATGGTSGELLGGAPSLGGSPETASGGASDIITPTTKGAAFAGTSSAGGTRSLAGEGNTIGLAGTAPASQPNAGAAGASSPTNTSTVAGSAGAAGFFGLAGAPTAGSTGSNASCTLRIALNGNDQNDGATWAHPLGTIQQGLDKAASAVSLGSCSSVELWVAAGIYKPTRATNTSDPRTATFQLLANVALLGGFNGSESESSQRDIPSNVTILSGDIGNPGTIGDNCYHVVMGANGATLDGFTVADGNGEDTFGHFDAVHSGAGMINDSASPTVRNCIFANNRALRGAGMYNHLSAPVLKNCAFANNSATWNGSGGGIYNDAASPVVNGCAFTSNYADSYGGGMYTNAASPSLVDCTFTDNRAPEGYGGGMYNKSGSPTLTSCQFSGNSAREGGGIFNVSVSATATLTNCAFTKNKATSGPGSAIKNGSSSPVLTNCTFTGNYSEHGTSGALHNISSSTPTVNNCIFWGDKAVTMVREIANDASSSAMVSSSIVDGGYAGVNITMVDPLFVDAANDDVRLSPNSPAIDAGDGCAPNVLTTDKVGNVRWDIAAVPNALSGLDIGAYEFQGSTETGTVISAFSCR